MTDNVITTVHGDGETAPAKEPAPPLSAEYTAIVERLLPVNLLTAGGGRDRLSHRCAGVAVEAGAVAPRSRVHDLIQLGGGAALVASNTLWGSETRSGC
jgi:hypothetical protein